jgi:hypothetical protein
MSHIRVKKKQSSYRSDVSHIHFGTRREARRRNQLRYEARQRVGISLFLVPLTHQEIDGLFMVASYFISDTRIGHGRENACI